MLRSLENCVPRWALVRICKRTCECGHKYEKADVVQIGIRKVKRGDGCSECLSVEVLCPVCNKGSVTTFAHKKSFRQLLCLLLQELQKRDHMEASRKIEKNTKGSKITDKEFADFKIQLGKMKSHSELLSELGIELNEDED